MGTCQYTLHEKLGAGQFSSVWKGYHKDRPDKLLAVKVLDLKRLFKTYPTYEKYLKREIATLIALKGHINIVEYDSYQIIEDVCYIAMEYCTSDLDVYIESTTQKKLTEQDAKFLMRQIANGLRYMITFCYAHRDLKPANILISKNGDEIVLKISDFGFARVMEKDSALMQASLLGTPHFMAPEVEKKQPYSDKCDLWSVGMILYAMLFGKASFLHRNGMLREGRAENIIKQHEGQFSQECDSLLMGLLQQDPAKRMTWMDFFSHPFLYEAHPQLSLLECVKDTNAIQVVTFPSLETFAAVVDYKASVADWKRTNKFTGQCMAVLCHDTDINKSPEPTKWSGIEMRDYDIMARYKILEPGVSTEKCIFIFENHKPHICAKNLLDLELGSAPILREPNDIKLEDYLLSCSRSVTELYEDIDRVWTTCSKFVLTRKLIICSFTTLFASYMNKKLGLETQYLQLRKLFDDLQSNWGRIRGQFDHTCATIERIPMLSLPLFLLPNSNAVDELLSGRKKVLVEAQEKVSKINNAFAVATDLMNCRTPDFRLDELEDSLNREIYNYVSNVKLFKAQFETASRMPQSIQKIDDATGRKNWLTLLNFSKVMNDRVRAFYEKCKGYIPETIELVTQTHEFTERNNRLTTLIGDSDPLSTGVATVPNLMRAIQTLTEMLASLREFVDLPMVVEELLQTLHERQRYEKTMDKIIPRVAVLLNTLYNRHHGDLDRLCASNKTQIDALFPGMSKLGPLPRPKVVTEPDLILAGYDELNRHFVLPPTPERDERPFDFDQEFSFILSETTSASDLVRDNAQLAEKLRVAMEAQADALAKLKRVEANGGIVGRVGYFDQTAALNTAERKIADMEKEMEKLRAESASRDAAQKAERTRLEEERREEKRKREEERKEEMRRMEQERRENRLMEKDYKDEKRRMEDDRVEEKRRMQEERAKAAEELEVTKEMASALAQQIGYLKDQVLAYELSYDLANPKPTDPNPT